MEMQALNQSDSCVSMPESWPKKLFSKSVLKQAKLKQLLNAVGEYTGKTCLDLGSDNGVISLLLRERGGDWSSADLTEQSVRSIKSLVGERVYKVDGVCLPFTDESFDVVVVVDMLEHVEDDRQLILEMARILKPGGQLVLNVPNMLPGSVLRWFRHQIGQTDEAHGHLRSGYSRAQLESLVGDLFQLESSNTYSRFFSELIDTLIVLGYSIISGNAGGEEDGEREPSKGLVVTEGDMKKFDKKFKIYSAIFPIVWAVSRLDAVIFWTQGFMRIASGRKRAVTDL